MLENGMRLEVFKNMNHGGWYGQNREGSGKKRHRSGGSDSRSDVETLV